MRSRLRLAIAWIIAGGFTLWGLGAIIRYQADLTLAALIGSTGLVLLGGLLIFGGLHPRFVRWLLALGRKETK